jgi:1-acyl-sn-glycerol-3-phosphate acyltransferase
MHGEARLRGDAERERDDQARAASLPPRRCHWIYRLGWLCLWLPFRRFFGMRGEGVERLPTSGPFLLAPNHVSMLDWAILFYFFPRGIRFVVHREYYDHPILGIGLRINGAVAVRTDRPDLTAMRVARAVLRAGEPLVLFPEGGISLTGRPQRAQPGIISLASATHVPIVPVAIRGAFEAFPRWRRLPHPGRITVVFGHPLPPPPKARGAVQQALADRLMDHITALLDGVPNPPPPW